MSFYIFRKDKIKKKKKKNFLKNFFFFFNFKIL